MPEAYYLSIKFITKKIIDYIISIIILIITFPFWAIIAITIKIDSSGPVIFKQTRVGYKGEHFTIYKFRTMYLASSKHKNKPYKLEEYRITKVGTFLRTYSLDELPQLINIIKGNMSLVGPRPQQLIEVQKYNRDIYNNRHSVLPGLTGLWQVSGRKDKPLGDNIKYDLYYIKNRSIGFDIIILLRTIPVVISRKGAY